MTMMSCVGHRRPGQVFAESDIGNDIGTHFLIAY